MTVYVFGNPDSAVDCLPFQVMAALQGKIPRVNFVPVAPNADLPFADAPSALLLDTVSGLDRVTLLDQHSLDKLIASPRLTAHDYDLGFQLKYLRKLGKLPRLTIVGLPPTGPIDYLRVQSILRKLVEQDIQGS